ncbi:uncharacterized protein LOC133792552 [Humulus lupulus]|uniref:uncharacterized protein LOC133792552 n=1 Tax=Humulus lupulus TaxID=3486 RepID=UPI002B418648|nr:uncharacterized protein LOC133792552 [Humulus lupulus]
MAKIVSTIGEMVRQDRATGNWEKLQFARALIEVNLTKDLPAQIKFDDEKGDYVYVEVFYEWKPELCSQCQGIGHVKEDCRKRLQSSINSSKDLTKREIFPLGEELSNYVVGKELRGCVERDMKRVVGIQCYKGIRNREGLPSRRQRTRTNAQTKKSHLPIPLALRKK